MENEFISYDLALRMKALGFDERCMSYFANGKWREGTTYNSDQRDYESVAAPTWQSAFDWFREKYFYISYVCAPYKEYNEFFYRLRHIGDVIEEGQLESCESKVYFSYEEAQQAALEKLCKIVEEKQKA